MILWNTATGAEIRRLRQDRKPVWAVAFSPDGTRALSGGHAELIKVWDLKSGKDVTP